MFLSVAVSFAILELFSLLHGELICLDSTQVPFYASTVLVFDCIDKLTATCLIPFLIRRRMHPQGYS